MRAFEIPTTPNAQRMTITLASVDRILTLRWNVPNATWILDIASSNGDPILQGIPLVTGANLLEQFDYLELGGGLAAQTDHTPDSPPTFADLGSTGHLYFLTAP